MEEKDIFKAIDKYVNSLTDMSEEIIDVRCEISKAISLNVAKELVSVQYIRFYLLDRNPELDMRVTTAQGETARLNNAIKIGSKSQ